LVLSEYTGRTTPLSSSHDITMFFRGEFPVLVTMNSSGSSVAMSMFDLVMVTICAYSFPRTSILTVVVIVPPFSLSVTTISSSYRSSGASLSIKSLYLSMAAASSSCREFRYGIVWVRDSPVTFENGYSGSMVTVTSSRSEFPSFITLRVISMVSPGLAGSGF